MPRSNRRQEYATLPKGSNVNRSSFNISKNHKTSFDGNFLIPMYWDYFYPGEVVRGNVQAFVRMSSPLDFPLMDNIVLTAHWYSVPLRILWDNFRKFYGERTDPADSIDYTIPEIGSGTQTTDASGNAYVDLLRYMEVPVVVSPGVVNEADVSALPFRAYWKIWNWHYRDQQQIDSLTELTDDGPDDSVTYTLQRRGKRHDYYTAGLPAPQRGEALTLDVETDSAAGAVVGIYSNNTEAFQRIDTDAAIADVGSGTAGAEAGKAYAGTINDLRNAVALQQFLERDNRYGQRFDEQIWAHFGVEFNDVRIAPLYLGGGSGYINTSTIPNQSATTGNLGDLAAIAHGSLDGARFTYAFDEPSILMLLINVSADITYQQGLQRKHSLRTRYDMFYPEFTRIGDQAVLTQEIFYNNDANDATVFSYVPRYEHMRTGVNWVSGEFTSQLTTGSLDSWHLAEELGGAPVLGQTWIQQSTDFDRVQQVTTAHDFLGDFQINLNAARALPINGVPGLARL